MFIYCCMCTNSDLVRHTAYEVGDTIRPEVTQQAIVKFLPANPPLSFIKRVFPYRSSEEYRAKTVLCYVFSCISIMQLTVEKRNMNIIYPCKDTVCPLLWIVTRYYRISEYRYPLLLLNKAISYRT